VIVIVIENVAEAPVGIVEVHHLGEGELALLPRSAAAAQVQGVAVQAQASLNCDHRVEVDRDEEVLCPLRNRARAFDGALLEQWTRRTWKRKMPKEWLMRNVKSR